MMPRVTANNTARRDFIRLLTGAVVCSSADALWAAEGGDFIPASRLRAASQYCAKRKSFALYVRQHGKVIHEGYFNGASRGEARRIYSGTKGFWGLAALAAVEDGIISLDEHVADTIHEWRNKEGKDRLTIKQLLLFTCGLERGLKIHQNNIADRNATALNSPMVAKPGQAFIYGPSALQVFHEVLKRKLATRFRHETPTRYLERRVLRPMGLGSQRYVEDQKGNPLLAAGFLMTPEQWCKMGDVLLRAGAPVLRSSFDQLTEGSPANSAYAFGFWNNRAAGRGGREIDVENMLERPWNQQSWNRACICRQAPRDLIACIGSGYQRLFVVPSQNLIIIRQGLNAKFSDAEFLRLLLG